MASKIFLVCCFTVIALQSCNFVKTFPISPSCPIINDECNCVFNSPFYSLKCTDIENEEALDDITRNLSSNAVALEIGSLNWESFPLETFLSVTVHTLIIKNSTFDVFRNISANALNATDFIPLHHLSLENVTIEEEWDWEQLSPLRNLEVLFLYNTTIGNRIPHNFSQYLSSNLSVVTIAESNVTSVESKSFELLHNLTYLRISHGQLTTFNRNVLPVPSHVQQLRLDYNKIRSLPCDIFNDMPDLKVVSLSNNTLSTLSEEVFSQLWSPGIHLDIRDNPIKCDCRLLWTVTSETKPENVIGQCAHPKRLFGKDIKDLTVEDISCSD